MSLILKYFFITLLGTVLIAFIPQAFSDSANESINVIVKQGGFKVGVRTNTPGLGYIDPISEEYTGFEVDLAKQIAAKFNTSVTFIPVKEHWQDKLNSVNNEDTHMVISCITITDERKTVADLTSPYYIDECTLLVNKNSGISSLNDIMNKKVGTLTGTVSAKFLVDELIAEKLIKPENTSNFDVATWNNGLSFFVYDTYDELANLLNCGKIDAILGDKITLTKYITENRQFINKVFAPQHYGILLKKDSQLTAILNKLISKWTEDGTLKQLATDNGLTP